MTRKQRAGTLALFILVLVLPGAALAGSSPANPVTIGVQAGYDQRYVPGRGIPISVVLESTRSVAGDLEVSSLAPDGSSLVRAIPVEVPSGGRKQFDLVVPGPGLPSPRVSIAVREGSETLASARVELIATGDQMLVGTLAEQPAPPAGARIEPTGHEIRPVVVPEAWLELGAGALQPLSYLIVDSEAGRALNDDQRQSILDWVVTGGRLLVTTRDAAAVDWLPESWLDAAGRTLPGGGQSRVAGLGRLLVVPNGAPADLGPAVAAMTPPPTASDNPNLQFGVPGVDFELLSALSSNSGNSIRLGWLVGFLIVYVVLAGPVNYFVLRKRGRKELAWVTVPLVALLFSGVAYGLARSARGGLAVQQASVVFATAEGSASQRLVTVSSGAGGRFRVGFDSRDAVSPWGAAGFQDFGGGAPARRRQVVRLTGSGSEAILETSPFSAGISQGSVPSSPGYLDGDLSWDGAALVGTVTNRTTMTLDVVVARPGGRQERVGELEAGASRDVRIEGSQEAVGPPIMGFPPMLPGSQGSKENLRRVLTGNAYTMLGAEHSFGTPMLVGFTDEYAPELRVDGSTRTPAGPAVIVSPIRVTVPEGAAGKLPASAGRMEIVSVDGGAVSRNQSLQLQDFREAVFAYQLPAGVDASQVKETTLTKGFGGPGFRTEVFDFAQNRWVAPLPGGNPTEEKLPAGAFSASGQAYLRITPQLEPYLELWAFNVAVSL